MPGKVKVKILAGRNLPVMDRSSDTTDAYVEIKLGSITHKTDVFRKSLNPQWNSEWFLFELDDAELQDEPLQIRLMDYDTYSANDAIGKVYLDLNPLLVMPGHPGRGLIRAEACSVSPSGGTVLSGWLPVYDTMHGMRGEVSVIVKVELFSDVNKFRQSSCGVQFFSTPSTPYGFKIQSVQGFVKELVVNDDPEYQWIDKIRTPRASNEARQTLFSQLSGEVRRKIGLKVLELGGNAVLGYQQMFDLEGVTGLVVRGIGTAVTLSRCHADGSTAFNWFKESHNSGRECDNARLRSHQSEPVLCPLTQTTAPRLHRLQSLPVHENSSLIHLQASQSPVVIGGSSVLKAAVRRKLSLSNLFAKPGSKGKVPKLRETTTSSTSNTLSIPSVGESSGCSPLVRVRSRSAPFCEMSPIQENHGESANESQDGSSVSSNKICLPVQSIEVSNVEFKCTEPGTSQKVLNVLKCEQPLVECLVGSSDDSCSSDSEQLFHLHFPTSKEQERHDEQLIVTLSLLRTVDCSLDLSSNVALNANTHPPLPELQPVCPNPVRSPRCPAISPVETNKAFFGTVPTPIVHGATPSRPSPCPRRSSESEINTTPKASSLSDSFGSSGGGVNHSRPHRQTSVPAPTTNAFPNGSDCMSLEFLEYPFLTMKTYPPGFIVHIGGTVSARSVKLLDRINNSEEPETRDNWWTEIRMEVRSHARALGCSVILGYEEHTSIWEEVCVLSASGTAAVVKLQQSDLDIKDADHKRDNASAHHGKSNSHAEETKVPLPCHVCHIPYSKASIPFPIKLSRCAVCRKGRVPDVLIATIEPPSGVSVTGRGCLIQARLCRPKRAESRGDQQAKEVSDGLPFLEYELHSQLINKLRIKGMNSIFGLKVQVSIGERHVVGVATGTAIYFTALPAPTLPMPMTSSISSKQVKRSRIQKLLTEALTSSKERYGLNKTLSKVDDVEESKWTDSEDSDEDTNDLDLAAGNKDPCVIEIDDVDDVDIIELLIDSETPEGFDVVTTEKVPGLPVDNIRRRTNLQAFNRVWKGKIPTAQGPRHLNRCFEMILRSIFFKLRKSRPCVITNLQFSIDLPEEDEIQITVLGTAITASGKSAPESVAPSVALPKSSGSMESEMIFLLEDDSQVAVLNESAPSTVNFVQQSRQIPPPLNQASLKNASDKAKLYIQKERQPVDIVTLIYLPGSRVERYLGHLNFFFIRESTSIREDGGLSGFMQSFITEVLAIVRAHVSALGGNAIVSYFMTQCVLLHNPHKNQGQCLINVGGDVVQAIRCCPDKDV